MAYDPLGILNDTSNKGQQQVDPLGILPSKKKVGGASLSISSGAGPKSDVGPEIPHLEQLMTFHQGQQTDALRRQPTQLKTIDPEIIKQRDIEDNNKINDAIIKSGGDAERAAFIYNGVDETGMAEAKAGNYVKNFLNKPNVIQRAQQDPNFKKAYNTAKFNFQNHYPTAALKDVNQKIGQYMEDKGMANAVYNNPSQEKADKAVDEMREKGLLSDREVNLYTEKTRPRLGTVKSYLFGSPIPTADVVNEFSKSLQRQGGNIAEATRDVLHNASLGAISYPEEQRIAEQQDYSTPMVEPKGEGKKMALNIADILGFATPAILGEVAGIPAIGTMSLQFEGQNRHDAMIKYPDDKTKQDIYTILTTGVDMIAGQKLPLGQAGKAISGIVDDVVAGKITEQAAKNKYLDFVKDWGKSTASGTLGLETMQVGHNAADAALGGKNFSLVEQGKQALENLPADATAMAFMGGIAASRHLIGGEGRQYRTMDLGKWEGTPENDQAKQKFAEVVEKGNVPAGETGETFDQFVERNIPSFENSLKYAPDHTTIVTHSSNLKLFKTWDEMGRPPIEDIQSSGKLHDEFAKKYLESETQNGDLDTFKGDNGDIHVIRHGETEDNQKNNFRSGNTNLTEQGIKDAEKSGQKLKELTGGEIPNIIASDLPRAQHSAEIIKQQFGEKKGVSVIMPEENKPPNIVEPTKTEEPPPPTEPSSSGLVYFQYPPTQLSHGGVERIGGEHDFEPTNKYETSSILKWNKEADDLMAKGFSVQNLLHDVNAGEHVPTPAERVVLTRYAAELQKKLRETETTNPEYDHALEELQRVVDVANFGGSQTGASLGAIGHIKVVPDGSYSEFMLNELAANNNAPLTDAQKTRANDEWNKFNAAKDKLDADQKAFEQKVAAFRAEQELGAIKKTTTKRRTHEDLAKERDDILKNIKDKWMGAGKDILSSDIPYRKQLAAIAPDVLKLARNLVEDGILKLEEVVSHIHDKLKDAVPELQEKDVHDIIAGEYTRKITKKDAAIKYENLRIEAKLLNKLEALTNGEIPSNEKAKVKRNQEIEDLRQKINSFKKESAIANKFYGESDATQRRVEKMEDELQRLKDRKEKETQPKKQKELTDRERELKEQIAQERKAFNKEKSEANKFYGEEFDTGVKQLKSLIEKNKKATQKVKEQIAKGDFAPEVKKTPLMEDKELQKKFPELFKQTQKSLDEYIKVKREISIRRLKQMYENKTPQERAVEVFSKTLNIPRTLMASWDFSAPLRQGIVASVAHPAFASRALKFMFQATKSEKIYNRWLEEVHNDPRWNVAEKTKLGITDPESLHVKEKEEAFQGAPYAEKIPLIGAGVKASERAYIGFLNHLRWNLFNMYADRFEAMGKTYENNPELYKGLSSMINSETGRGGMKGLEGAAPVINWFLFASKLIASRLNLLGLSDVPNLVTRAATLGKYGVDYGFYSKLPADLRLEAAKDMAKFIGIGMATLAMAKMMGANVEDDPRSSDFGKIHVGNTRWDIWGGFQPYARVLTQTLTGQRKTTTTGNIQDLSGRGFMSETRLSPLSTFARQKLAPVPGTAIDLITGRDATGQQVTIPQKLLQDVVPLLAQDVYQGMKDQGVKAIFTVGIPSAFGVGVQTFQQRQATPQNKFGGAGAKGGFKKEGSKPKHHKQVKSN